MTVWTPGGGGMDTAEEKGFSSQSPWSQPPIYRPPPPQPEPEPVPEPAYESFQPDPEPAAEPWYGNGHEPTFVPPVQWDPEPGPTPPGPPPPAMPVMPVPLQIEPEPAIRAYPVHPQPMAYGAPTAE